MLRRMRRKKTPAGNEGPSPYSYGELGFIDKDVSAGERLMRDEQRELGIEEIAAYLPRLEVFAAL